MDLCYRGENRVGVSAVRYGDGKGSPHANTLRSLGVRFLLLTEGSPVVTADCPLQGLRLDFQQAKFSNDEFECF